MIYIWYIYDIYIWYIYIWYIYIYDIYIWYIWYIYDIYMIWDMRHEIWYMIYDIIYMIGEAFARDVANSFACDMQITSLVTSISSSLVTSCIFCVRPFWQAVWRSRGLTCYMSWTKESFDTHKHRSVEVVRCFNKCALVVEMPMKWNQENHVQQTEWINGTAKFARW